MNRRVYIAVFGVLLIALATVGTVAYQQNQASKQANAAAAQIERTYLEQMSRIYTESLKIAKGAQQQAQTKTVKQLAGGMVTAQTAELSQMSTWYSQWYGAALIVGDTNSKAPLGRLDAAKLLSSADYDMEFVDQMVPHHRQAIELSKRTAQQAKRSQVKTLANDVSSSMGFELQRMESLQISFKQYSPGSVGRRVIDCGDDSPGC